MLVPNLTADHHTCRVTDGCKITDSSRRLQSADLSMATVSAGAHYHKASMMQWQRLTNDDGAPQSLPPGWDLEVAHLRDENPNLRGKGLQIHIRHILVKKVIKTLRNLLGIPVEIAERH